MAVLQAAYRSLRRNFCSTKTVTSFINGNRLFSDNATVTQDKLFTPGPLNVSMRVKKAMLRDVGTRHSEFVNIVRSIRQSLLEVAGANADEFTTVPVQGSGTYAVEATVATAFSNIPGKVLILENGSYGKRIASICSKWGVETEIITFPETEMVDPSVVDSVLSLRENVIGVAMVHCETSTGVINPIGEVGEVVKRRLPDSTFFVDAMSSFGAIPLLMTNIDFMVSSANKCLQGVPGFSYVIAKKSKLNKLNGNCRSLVLDLAAQVDVLDNTGQFRFTPPTHAMLAFKEALTEFHEEGGVLGRSKRYSENASIIRCGMESMGFKTLLDHDLHPQSYIITSFYYPATSKFVFENFYEKLSRTGHVIYPGQVSTAKCFRIGTIGHLYPDDMQSLIDAIRNVCHDIEV
nr:uncharacterized protein LOC100182814 [Ciona intestinalis]XP_026690076.1 uncharacterized protein LOC100182814 [Ciona intestinalis]|eukprot:XP_002121769.1 uncharacterized protein LOC100182814 [Ciona intestinalis]